MTADVNVVSKSHRSAAELKTKWQTLASEATADLAHRKHRWTGGGPPRKEGIYAEINSDVFGDESALIDGMEGGIDVGDESMAWKAASMWAMNRWHGRRHRCGR